MLGVHLEVPSLVCVGMGLGEGLITCCLVCASVFPVKIHPDLFRGSYVGLAGVLRRWRHGCQASTSAIRLPGWRSGGRWVAVLLGHVLQSVNPDRQQV